MTERSLFLAALDRPDPAARAAYLDGVCGADAALRHRVEVLLGAHAAPGRFMNCPAPVDLAGTLVAGRYRLVEPIGEGGMGQVWLAEQTEPVRRRVAVKLIRVDRAASAAIVSRFAAERQAIAVMDHTNIARLLDAGVCEGRPYFVMELVNGVPVTDFCATHHLTLHHRLHLFLPICAAVQHAHQKGIIHRDLKPSNILVENHDDVPVPKVIDFGLAKATVGLPLADGTLLTGLGSVLGSPQYMAPEQATFHATDVDTRADVYALGVILYELLTGTTPLGRDTVRAVALDEMLRLIREQEAPAPSSRTGSADTTPGSAHGHADTVKLTRLVRGELDWIVLKALAKERDRRYASAAELADDVRRFLAHEPVRAGPPTVGYRLRKFVRRHRGPVLAAAVMLAALLAGAVGTTAGLIEARRQARLAAARADAEARERERAVRSGAQTLEALRAATGRDVELLIGSKPVLSATERQYLEAIAARWQAFARQAGTDTATRGYQAEGHFRVADLWTRLGRLTEARGEYEVARDLRAGLVVEAPDDPERRRAMGETHINLGVLLLRFRDDRARTELEAARDLYQRLVEQGPGYTEDRANLARARNNLGLFHRRLGDLEAARAEFTAARDLRGPDQAGVLNNLGAVLAALGRPEEARVELEAARDALLDSRSFAGRRDLADARHNLGRVYAQLDRRADGRTEYAAAIDLQRALANEFAAVPDYRRALATTHNSLGLLARADDPAAARRHFEAARDLQAGLDEEPDDLDALAGTHTNLALLLDERNDPTAARAEYAAACAVRERLAKRCPDVREYAVRLGGSLSDFGVALAVVHQRAKALDAFGRAVETLTPVVEGHSRDETARRYLRNCYENRARVLGQQLRHTDALADWDRALALTPAAERPTYRVFRAGALIYADRIAAAVAEMDELTKLPGWSAAARYEFARMYALAGVKDAAKRSAFSARAVASLENAAQAGYSDVTQLDRDPALDSLRGRADYKKMRSNLAPAGSAR
jgi:eukaryotic-like serine/threonine-protein kinase